MISKIFYALNQKKMTYFMKKSERDEDMRMQSLYLKHRKLKSKSFEATMMHNRGMAGGGRREAGSYACQLLAYKLR